MRTYHPVRTLAAARGVRELARPRAGHADASLETWVKAHAKRHGVPDGLIRPPSEVDRAAAPAVAYVSHGDWLADCPDGCGGAECVEPGWPMMCANCGNVLLGGRWRPVDWPSPGLRARVEQQLTARPFDKNRSWYRFEPVDRLRFENALAAVVPPRTAPTQEHVAAAAKALGWPLEALAERLGTPEVEEQAKARGRAGSGV